MIINNHLLGDLFLESHMGLALKSIITLNNHNCFLVVRSDSEIKILKINNEKLSMKQPGSKLNYFLSFQINDVDFNYIFCLSKEMYIIYNNLLIKCRYFDRQPRRPNEFTLIVTLIQN